MPLPLLLAGALLIASPVSAHALSQDQRALDAFADRREAALAEQIAIEGLTVERAQELSMLQERRGAVGEAEATLRRASTQFPGDRGLALTLVRFLVRTSRAAQGMEVFEEFAQQHADDRTVHFTMATLYEDLVRNGPSLTGEEKRAYIPRGIAAADRAIALDPTYADAVDCKALLLFHQARLETNPDRRQELQSEAERLRAYASELRRNAVSGAPSVFLTSYV